MSEIEYKFHEPELLQEVLTYIDSTYSQHYATEKHQATDIIIDAGHGVGFCLGNILKYCKRYSKKGTPDDWRKDILKIIHYAVILLDTHDNTLR